MLIRVSSTSVATTSITLYFEQITTNMVGILRNIWMFCIGIKHKSRCGTKIFHYTCNLLKVLFMIFLLKSFTSNVFCEILYWYCKPFSFEHFENGWSCPSMMIVSPYRTLFCPMWWNKLVGNFDVCLQAKIYFMPNFFFQMLCKDIANLLLWELWKWMTNPIKYPRINL